MAASRQVARTKGSQKFLYPKHGKEAAEPEDINALVWLGLWEFNSKQYGMKYEAFWV